MGSDWYGGFAGNDEEASEEPLWRRPQIWSPPENEVPVGVAGSTVLARTGQVALYAAGFQAFRTGVLFTVSLRMTQAIGRDVMELFMGHAPHRVEPADLLLLGVEFADGTKVFGNRSDRQGGPLLSEHGGGGGGRTFDKSVWLHPLPPPGPLTFVCTWRRLGIDETRVVIDGTVLAEAGARAEVLWPWEPEEAEPLDEFDLDQTLPGWFGGLSP